MRSLASAIEGAFAPDVLLALARFFARGCGGLWDAAGDKGANEHPAR